MPRVVSHVEVEAVPEGGVLHVDEETLVTPLAREKASERGVRFVEGDGHERVREITRRVVSRMAGESPEVIEAVVTEIIGAMAPGALGHGSMGPRMRPRERAILTVTGRNAKGICALTTTTLAQLGADILDISQTIVADFFTMIVVFDISELTQPFDVASGTLQETLASIGMKATVMHEDVLQSLHRV
ncbi:MAG: ACT domain-containing protein [Polyangia bacterium]